MTEMDEAAERERRRRYIEDMYDLVADMHASSSMPRAMPEPGTQSFGDMPLLSSEPIKRWRREAEEAEQRRAAAEVQTSAEINAQRTRDWERWLAGHLEIERAAMIEGVGEALGQVRAQLRDEIQEAVGQLRAEISIQRAHESGKVTDLPNPLVRKSDAAA